MIGQRVKKLREQAGLTRAELADRAGVDEKTIWNYENNARGVKAPPLPTLKAIAKALGVELSELLADPASEVAATP